MVTNAVENFDGTCGCGCCCDCCRGCCCRGGGCSGGSTAVVGAVDILLLFRLLRTVLLLVRGASLLVRCATGCEG